MGISNLPSQSRNVVGIAAAAEILRHRFGANFLEGKAICGQHAHTATWITPQAPDGVVYVESAKDVSDVVKIAAEHRVPLIPFGAGSSLEGQVNAPRGGFSLDFSKMNRLLTVNQEDLDCTVEPGMTREDLNRQLRDTGLFFPIDPGANATIGGMTSTRASGTNAVRYGTMKDNVLALTFINAKGEEIRTAHRARKSSAGYDLTRLIVGAEGTLGILTSVTLRLQGIPEEISGGTITFPTVKAACDAVITTIQLGIPVARLELLNPLQVRACNAYSGMNHPELPTLFLEFHGTPESVALQSAAFNEIASDHGAGPFAYTTDATERAKLWKARHDVYWAARGLRPGASVIATDVCVPISRLADCVTETEADIDSLGLIAPIVGHVGDGNFHVSLMVDTTDPAEVTRAEDFIDRLNARALSMDGTCTGEHGIGQGKQDYLKAELGNAVDMMRTIKQALDPLGIFNPGKIFAMPDDPSHLRQI